MRKIPINVEGIEFDALLSSDEHYESDIPEYPTEDGYAVEDTIILKPFTLDMTLFVSDMPVTYRSRFGGKKRVEEVCSQLIDLYSKKAPITISTRYGVYHNMGIVSLTISNTKEIGYAKEIPISFKRIDITYSRTATIPESYIRSGETMKNVGTANTSSTSKSGAGGSSKSKTNENGNGTGSSPEKKESQEKASILYKAGKGLGFIK